MASTQIIREWIMRLEYDDAVTFIEFIANVANCKNTAGFKKSVHVTPEVIEICQDIIIEAQKDFEFEPIESK